MDTLSQQLKVQLLEMQKAWMQQNIELTELRLEKLEQVLIRERMVLAGMVREQPMPDETNSHSDSFAHTKP